MESTQKQFDHVNGNYVLDSKGPKKSIEKIWNKSNFKAVSAPFVYEGILYVSKDGFFYAMDPDTGSVIWEYIIPGRATIPVFFENILIFGGNYIDNYIYALNKDTGEEIWKYYTGAFAASVQTPPVIHNDHIYALAGKRIHCLAPLTGKKQWSFNLKKSAHQKNLIMDSEKIYATTDEGCDKQELHCVDIAKKEEVWKIKTPNLNSNLLKIQDFLFYLNSEAELCQVNTLTQEVTKSMIVTKDNRARNLHLSYHDGIIVIVIDYDILGLNVATDPWSWQWNFHSSGIIGRPVITDNCIYFATCGSGVSGLDLYTGKPLFHKNSDIRSTHTCGIYDSKIFVAGSMSEHELAAYEEEKQSNWSIGNIFK